MRWIDKIRQKPHTEKVRLIWIICLITAGILIVIWILTSRLHQNLPKDTSLFEIMIRSVKNLR